MATVTFSIKGKNNPSTVLVRFTNGRKYDFKRSTSIQVNPNHWNHDKGVYRKVSTPEDRDEKNGKLQNLRTFILDSYNEDFSKGVIISSDWLNQTIFKYNNQTEETDLSQFVQYGEYFIENLPNRINNAKGSKLGVAESTVKKYQSIVNKIKKFDQHHKRKLYIQDVNLKFQKDFIYFLRNVEKLGENTTGRQLRFIKTICKDAKQYGIKTHPELEKIKGFHTKVDFVYLNEKEIDSIVKHDFSKSPYLDNARDWLIVGLYSGQRISDFMSFSIDTIKEGFFEFEQIKTGAKTLVPIHSDVQNIIDKYNGDFPRKISEQKFNEYIKIVCKEVEINELVDGGKLEMIEEGKNIKKKKFRKVYGKYPKYELITSHICRRSFSTNHYGKLETPVLMSITNHSTEKMFLTYIGKTPKDHAEQLKEYWEQLRKNKNNEEPPMEVVKSQAK